MKVINKMKMRGILFALQECSALHCHRRLVTVQTTIRNHADALEQSIESLKELSLRVTRKSSQWIEGVGDAIDCIHERLRQYIVMTQTADGLFSE